MNLLSVGAAYGVLDARVRRASTRSRRRSCSRSSSACRWTTRSSCSAASASATTRRATRARAVAEGLATSARTITSAALIMVAVFVDRSSPPALPSIQQIGLGSAVAIAVDATIVRLVLVPAAMELLGSWNWWLPRPLERLLPETSFEELADPA